jgi:hypothetical protein
MCEEALIRNFLAWRLYFFSLPRGVPMKKTRLFLLVLILIQGCSNQPSYNIKPTATPKIQDSVLAETQTPTVVVTRVQATSTPMPTLTPTPTPDPYVFTGVTGNMNLTSGPIVIEFTNGALGGKKITTNLISPEDLGGYNSTSEGLKVGNGVSVIRPDEYGNLLIGMHSGYYHNKPLDGEILRFFFENRGNRSDSYIQENLSTILGTKGVFNANGTFLNIEVTGAVRLQHPEAEELRTYPTKVFDIVTRKYNDGVYLALGNPEVFENAKSGTRQILLNFCGWGPGPDYSYYRYIVLLKVEEKQ